MYSHLLNFNKEKQNKHYISYITLYTSLNLILKKKKKATQKNIQQRKLRDIEKMKQMLIFVHGLAEN